MDRKGSGYLTVRYPDPFLSIFYHKTLFGGVSDIFRIGHFTFTSWFFSRPLRRDLPYSKAGNITNKVPRPYSNIFFTIRPFLRHITNIWPFPFKIRIFSIPIPRFKIIFRQFPLLAWPHFACTSNWWYYLYTKPLITPQMFRSYYNSS